MKKRDSAVHEDIGGLEHRPTAVHHIAGVSIWRYGAENSAKRKFTAPRALFAAPEIKKYSALARAGLVRTCSDDGECSAVKGMRHAYTRATAV